MAPDDRKRTQSPIPTAEWLMGTEDELIDFAALRRKPKTGLVSEETPLPRQPETKGRSRSNPSRWATDFLLNHVAGQSADVPLRSQRTEPAETRKAAFEPAARQMRSQRQPVRENSTLSAKPASVASIQAVPAPPHAAVIRAGPLSDRSSSVVLNAVLAVVVLGGLYGLSVDRPDAARDIANSRTERSFSVVGQARRDLPAAFAKTLPPVGLVQLASIAQTDQPSEVAEPAVTATIPADVFPIPLVQRVVTSATIAGPSTVALALKPIQAAVVPASERGAWITQVPSSTAPIRQPIRQVTARDPALVVAAINSDSKNNPQVEAGASHPTEQPTAAGDQAEKPILPLRSEHKKLPARNSAQVAKANAQPIGIPNASRLAASRQRQAISLPAALRPTPF